jgi:hypothetical protein
VVGKDGLSAVGTFRVKDEGNTVVREFRVGPEERQNFRTL